MKLPPLKIAAILNLVSAGISYWFDHFGASVYLSAALAMFLLSREVINDERVEHLKLKALSFGFGWGLVVTIWMNVLNKMLRSVAAMPTLSAFDALNIILLIALVMFHWWRWQDGRAVAQDRGEK